MVEYVTPDGRVLYKAETSKHHVFHERDWYRTPLQRKVRTMGGAVVQLANQPHRDLHANVVPPPLVNPNLMQSIYLHSRSPNYETAYDLFDNIVQYVGWVAAGSRQTQQNVEDASLLHVNLLEQAVFIEQGRLTIVEAQRAG